MHIYVFFFCSRLRVFDVHEQTVRDERHQINAPLTNHGGQYHQIFDHLCMIIHTNCFDF